MADRPILSREKIEAVLARLDRHDGPDRDLDEDIAEALGGQIRRVGRLGLTGRTRGSYRVFWPGKNPHGPGSQIPYFMRDRGKAKARLRKAIPTNIDALGAGGHD